MSHRAPDPAITARVLAPLLLVLLVAPGLPAQSTRAEGTADRETSRYVDVVGFVDSLFRLGAELRVGTLGLSPEGRPIPWVLASRPLVSDPAEARQSGKPIIYVQGNIHAGEVEGKEAALVLLRELTRGSLRPLLDSVVLLLVPIYNADGNERFAPGDRNRPGQNGPASVGRRANGQGLDLNRDYVKLEAPETRGALALIDRWQPDLFVDLHTSNGSYHGYALTWAPGLNPNSSPANDYARDHFLPLIRERMRRRHRLETFPYGNFRNQEPDSLVLGWETYDARPRFGTNSMGMQGRVPILSEAYSNNPFGQRIQASYALLREVLSLAAEERVQLRQAVTRSAAWRPDSVTIRSTLAPPTSQEVIAEITRADGDGSHGFARRIRTGVFRTIRMPVFDRFAPAVQVARPAAYLLPPHLGTLVPLLQVQGIVVERLQAGWQGAVEVFTVDSVAVAPFLFEGHRTVGVTGGWHPDSADLAPGWFYVDTDQRAGVLAAYLLEPASEDGLATWNFFDRELRPRATMPVLRLRAPAAVPRRIVQ